MNQEVTMFIKRFIGDDGTKAHQIGHHDQSGQEIVVHTVQAGRHPPVLARIEIGFAENQKGIDAVRQLLEETLASLEPDASKVIPYMRKP
jgi:hypothetical protein